MCIENNFILSDNIIARGSRSWGGVKHLVCETIMFDYLNFVLFVWWWPNSMGPVTATVDRYQV